MPSLVVIGTHIKEKQREGAQCAPEPIWLNRVKVCIRGEQW